MNSFQTFCNFLSYDVQKGHHSPQEELSKANFENIQYSYYDNNYDNVNNYENNDNDDD